MPWPIPLEEELLETLQRFKAVDEAQTGTITFEQYMQFFFRLFADFEEDPPQLDYTQMLLYFACHPDTVEGVYRALSVAVGTHIFPQVETPMMAAEKTSSSTDMSHTEEFPEPEENVAREEREPKEERDEREQKQEEIPDNVNTEKISLETLLKVFRGGNEVQDTNRFSSHLKTENIYAESFIQTFQDLGAKNLEPIEVSLLLKHPFVQDLIANYSDYKIPQQLSAPAKPCLTYKPALYYSLTTRGVRFLQGQVSDGTWTLLHRAGAAKEEHPHRSPVTL
ncbi:Sperm flagellar protein 2 [Sciurus carolinensis]|uniref:Sperm flagellar protein 2 n=1 Tax=Sciurus carolinensis TaxID=30640 RepID=A0AA41N984_SCICA|nr:Sperm flagellar protein 2 [Sciurus carolinensis]